MRRSSGTPAKPTPSVTTPNVTAATGATRCDLEIVPTGIPAPPADLTGMSQGYVRSVPRPLRNSTTPAKRADAATVCLGDFDMGSYL
jgi:hypothetical protein